MASSALFGSYPDPLGGYLVERLASDIGSSCRAVRTPVPACGLLSGLLRSATGERHPFMRALASVHDQLPGRPPGVGRIPEPANGGLATVEVIGLDGMFPCRDCRTGGFPQAPGVHHPAHRHQAEALYQLVYGTAEWQIETGEPRTRSPGMFVHHASGQVHAMRTGELPMVALWAWIGEIIFDSYAVLNQASGR